MGIRCTYFSILPKIYLFNIMHLEKFGYGSYGTFYDMMFISFSETMMHSIFIIKLRLDPFLITLVKYKLIK